MKTRLWEQTEEAFPYLRAMNEGDAAEQALAYDLITDLLERVISPKLRTRLADAARKYTASQKKKVEVV